MEFLGDLRQMVGKEKLQNQREFLDGKRDRPSLSLKKSGKDAYVPYPQQLLFHKSHERAFETLYGGAAGGGKSFGMLWDAYMHCVRHPGVHTILFRRTFPQLEKSLIFKSRTLFDSTMGHYSIKEKMWTIYTAGAPSYMHFGHCKNESDVYNYHSMQFDAEYFDELTHWTEFQYTYLLTRLRPNVEGVTPHVKASANPGGIGHGWVRRRWRLWDKDIAFRVYKPDAEGEEIQAPPSRVFVPALVTDNYFIMKNDPGYVERLKSSPYRRQLLEGDWSVFSGQAFPEFARGLHTCKSFPIPDTWERWISIDYGYSRPCAIYWHARDPQVGRIYTYKELYGAGIKEVDQARRTVGMSVSADGKPERILATIADPSVFSPRGGGSSIAEVYQSGGLYVERGNRERKSGKARVHSYLSMAPDGKPWWVIFGDKCPNLARTLPELVLDEHDNEDVDTTQEDHAYDSCRYFFMHIRPPKTSGGANEAPLLDQASAQEWDWYKKYCLKSSSLDGRSPISEINGVRE